MDFDGFCTILAAYSNINRISNFKEPTFPSELFYIPLNVRILHLSIYQPVNFGALETMKLLESQNFRLCQVILLIFTSFCLPTITFADRAFRCDGRLVYIGDPKTNVVSKCGEPDHIDQWEENPNGYTSKIYDYEKERYQLPELIKGPILIERWTYNLGSNQFTRYLFFQNGELYKIERGDK